ncbi:MAG: type 1 glutamine amidotransferase [Phycisphaerales bacterium]
MPIIVLQHEASEHLGRLAPVLRDLGHRCDVRRLWTGNGRAAGHIPADFDGVDGIISLGGSMNIADNPSWLAAEMAYVKEAHARQLPLLGVCLGAQIIAKALGGEVGPAAKPEWGFSRVSQTPPGNTDTILAGIPWGTFQFQMHNQEISKAPEGAVVLQSSPACRVQAFRCGLRTYGFQYHFEIERARLEAAAAGRCAEDSGCFSKHGLTQADLAAQMAEHEETFARLSTRLCTNLAMFMFPLMKKALGARG